MLHATFLAKHKTATELTTYQNMRKIMINDNSSNDKQKIPSKMEVKLDNVAFVQMIAIMASAESIIPLLEEHSKGQKQEQHEHEAYL